MIAARQKDAHGDDTNETGKTLDLEVLNTFNLFGKEITHQFHRHSHPSPLSLGNQSSISLPCLLTCYFLC